jgi:hypothetical protein
MKGEAMNQRAPSIKKEISIVKVSPIALSVLIGTPEAFEWFRKEADKYDDDNILFKILLPGKSPNCVPWSTVFKVSKCFDIDEVKSYLESFNELKEKEQADRKRQQEDHDLESLANFVAWYRECEECSEAFKGHSLFVALSLTFKDQRLAGELYGFV